MAEPGFASQLMEDLPPADVRHVLEVFAADLVRLHGTLCAQEAAGDQDAFCRTAHALAGAAGAVGAAGLETVCRSVMRPAAGVKLDLRASLEAIGAAAAAAETELQAVLRHLAAGDA
jgi:HPt (histidine-containing phosphotransfer) domain-containing protein